MKKSKSIDVLADPEIQRHTQRILALQEEERQKRQELGRIVAEIGAELIAVKEALDKTSDKTAWLRWLKNHVPLMGNFFAGRRDVPHAKAQRRKGLVPPLRLGVFA